MNKPENWKGTSLRIDSESENGQELINTLRNEGINLREGDSSEYYLENQSDYFIFENDYIDQSKNISSILTKISKKIASNDLKIYKHEEKSFIVVDKYSNDITKYQSIISENILDGDNRDINVSVNILNEVLNDSDKSRLFLDILILLAIGTKSKYTAEQVESEVRIDDKSYKTNIHLLHSKPLNLYPIYDWIINDEEYDKSYIVKLHVVRQVIVNKRELRDVEGVLEDSKLAYKRIVSRKTNDYFTQLNQLKEDFLVLSKNENNALRTLNITVFAWLGYLGVEVFKIIANYDGSDIFKYLIRSKGAKKGIVLIMFLIAIMFICLVYVLEIRSLEKTYTVIKNIYKDKILFEQDSKENKFEKIIKKPEVGKLQIVFIIIIIVFLIIRLILTLPW